MRSVDSDDGLEEDYRELLNSGQSLGTVLLDYAICTHCQYAYKIEVTTAHSCPACNKHIPVGRLFGPTIIYCLINLMQDHYRMELSYTTPTGEKIIEPKNPHHNVGIILIFSTFIECWMHFFLRSLMVSQKLSDSIIERLLSDNDSLDRRKGKLFKTLTTESFGDALNALSLQNKKHANGINYQAVWNHVLNIKQTRDAVLHRGAVYGLAPDVIGKCINTIHGVNSLFTSLHNRYVHDKTQDRSVD